MEIWMYKKTLIAFILLFFFLSGQPGWAKVFQSIDNTYTTTGSPIDVSGSADGQYTFVLTEGGKVVIYGKSGDRDEIMVDPAFDRIYASARGDKLWLSSKKDKKVRELTLDFVKSFNVDNAPSLGNKNAAVVIVVFSDFQWSYCAKLGALFEQVLENNQDKVKIVYKHYPLSSHRFAAPASFASVAAQEQGKFWQYHDLLFENYKSLNNDKLIEFAEQVQLNIPLFKQQVKSKEVQTRVANDYREGVKAGVSINWQHLHHNRQSHWC